MDQDAAESGAAAAEPAQPPEQSATGEGKNVDPDMDID